MTKKRGRPKKKKSEKKRKMVPVKMKPDFYDRLKSFSELTGFSMAKILRNGAIKFINEWHDKKQDSYNRKKEQ